MKKYLNLKCELLPITFLCTISFLLFGCAHMQSKFVRKMPTEFQEGDKIAVIINTQYYLQSSPKEQTILKCISEGFEKLDKEIKIVPPKMFRSIAFSDINLTENFSTKNAIENIIKNPSGLEKIKSIGIRYIILVEEPKKKESVIHRESGWEGGVAYGGPAIWYYIKKTTEKSFWLYGEIVDMEYYCISGYISSRSTGKSYSEIDLSIIPLGYYWPSLASESKACKEFGEAVAKFIVEQETNE